ncbi:hypothetical protein K1719_015471 [Acacia pycnantha]|nr:hypothetical protein K1719_015471 [Acacia pycnantha]
MPEEDLVELKFRLYDGSDIEPFNYSPASTVAMLKERIVAEWPKALACWLRQKTSFFGLKEASNVHHEG